MTTAWRAPGVAMSMVMSHELRGEDVPFVMPLWCAASA